jgi:hypothetical protein
MPAFNPQGFGSGFDGGVDTPVGGAGAFYAGGFGAGFAGGADNSAGSGAAFDSAAFGSGFYGGVNTPITGPLSLTPADIEAIALAVRAMGVNVTHMNGAQVVGTGTVGDAWRGVGV